MSERYQRVFSLSGELYSSGAPVIIRAGALLKDTQNGRILAQLKFKNIQSKLIRALQVEICSLDTAGRPLDVVSHQYLDLNEARDNEFGQKQTVQLDKTARSFTVRVTEVVFADGSLWNADGAEWTSLPPQEKLSDKLADPNLLCQYGIDYSSSHNLVPRMDTGLWRCGCCAVNTADEEKCHICGSALHDWSQFDIAVLRLNCDARLEKERKDCEKKRQEREAAEAETRRKQKKIATIGIPSVAALVALLLLTVHVFIPNAKYNAAVDLMDAGQYQDAITAFEAINGYRDSTIKIAECKTAILDIRYSKAVDMMKSGDLFDSLAAFRALDTHSDSEAMINKILKMFVKSETVCADYAHTIALKADGTVVAVGRNNDGQCNVSRWTDIVAISAGDNHTVGLKSNGAVVAVGANASGQCNVSRWTDIMGISVGTNHTVGLSTDNTVVAVGMNYDGRCDVSRWTDIVAISAGGHHTVGLRSDGTVVAVGDNDDGQCNVSRWTDIVAISAGDAHTVGLKADGTVVAVGKNDDGQCDVSGWTDIVAISSGDEHTVGLRANGTVVAVGENYDDQCNVSEWTDIVAISAGRAHTVGLRADGTVVAVGSNLYGQCDVSGWKNIRIPE